MGKIKAVISILVIVIVALIGVITVIEVKYHQSQVTIQKLKKEMGSVKLSRGLVQFSPDSNIASKKTSVRESPKVIEAHSPSYPASAKKVGANGRVFVQATVDTTGKVIDAKIIRSFGNSACDKEALKTARMWKFQPGTINGKPAVMKVVLPFYFPPP